MIDEVGLVRGVEGEPEQVGVYAETQVVRQGIAGVCSAVFLVRTRPPAVLM